MSDVILPFEFIPSSAPTPADTVKTVHCSSFLVCAFVSVSMGTVDKFILFFFSLGFVALKSSWPQHLLPLTDES
jgi:hypothetical protein